VSRVFSFAAQCVTKFSVLIFTRRIFSGNLYHEKSCFEAAYIFVAMYGVVAVLLSSAGCHAHLTLVPMENLVCTANVRSRFLSIAQTTH